MAGPARGLRGGARVWRPQPRLTEAMLAHLRGRVRRRGAAPHARREERTGLSRNRRGWRPSFSIPHRAGTTWRERSSSRRPRAMPTRPSSRPRLSACDSAPFRLVLNGGVLRHPSRLLEEAIRSRMEDDGARRRDRPRSAGTGHRRGAAGHAISLAANAMTRRWWSASIATLSRSDISFATSE